MWKKSLFVISVVLILPVGLFSDEAKKNEIEKEKTFVETILSKLGVLATANGLKGDEDMQSGELWIVDSSGKEPRKVSNGSSFKSPIFHGKEKKIFALSNGYLVKFDKQYGLEKAIKLFTVPDVSKLINSSLTDDKLLIIDANNTIGTLSLRDKNITTYVYDKKLDKNKELLTYLQGWSREYNDFSLFLHTNRKKTPFGDREWIDIYLKHGTEKAQNISKCDILNCSQPSLSQDKKSIVFIKELD